MGSVWWNWVCQRILQRHLKQNRCWNSINYESLFLENKKNHKRKKRCLEKISLTTITEGNDRSSSDRVSPWWKALPDFQAASGLHSRKKEDEIRSEVKRRKNQLILRTIFCKDEEDRLSSLIILLILDLDDLFIIIYDYNKKEQTGIEPVTLRFAVSCSSTELLLPTNTQLPNSLHYYFPPPSWTINSDEQIN